MWDTCPCFIIFCVSTSDYEVSKRFYLPSLLFTVFSPKQSPSLILTQYFTVLPSNVFQC